MVQTVKRSLRKAIGRAALRFDELNTRLIEIESVVNARPLTFVYDDCEGISYALTPSHLLYERRLATSPSASHFEIVSTNKSLTRRVKNQWHLLNQFVIHWRKEYLLSLHEFRTANVKGQGSCVRIGDVVILKDESVKRVFWKLVKVVELLKGGMDPSEPSCVDIVHPSESVTVGNQANSTRLTEQPQYWEKQPEEPGLNIEIMFAPLVIKQGECVRLYIVI